MKTVLIADDDQALLDRLVHAFSIYPDQFKVLSATDGAEAQKIIAREPVDMLVTDLEMPTVDGYELLAFMLENHPSVAMIVMSDFETDSLGEALGDIESVQCLQKPVSPEALLYRARAVFTRRAKGFVKGISLAGFLQLLNMEKKTCGLRVSSDSDAGTLEILEGEIINAVCEGLEGEEAVYKILSWEQPDIEMITSVLATRRAIGPSLPHLLFEAARKKDETARSEGTTLPPRPTIAPTEELLRAKPQITFHAEQLTGMKEAFARFLELPGVIGVAVVDMARGVCLVSEAGRLTPNFQRLASEASEVIRSRVSLLDTTTSDDRVEGLTVHLSQHVELYHPLQSYPDLVLYSVAERNQSDLAEALTQLMEIEELIETLEPATEAPQASP